MMRTEKQRWLLIILINIVPFIVFLLWWIYAESFHGSRWTDCPFYVVTKLYCAGCGGTRSVRALFQLNIADALRYHPFIPIGAVLFAVSDVALIVTTVRKITYPKILMTWIPRIYIASWFTFAIIRNVLLYFGIDMMAR